MALSSVGKRQEALEQLEAACQAAPQDADSHFLLALAANETGDTNRTVKELETVVRLNPLHERGWFNLALARSAKGDNKEALAALEQAGNLFPYDPWIPYTRAIILVKMRERNSAIESARQALVLQPDFREARELLNLIQ
jgi:tetratricopeptide (TPR) repeat protein